MGEAASASKKPTQQELDDRVEAEYAVAQYDRSPGGRLDQLLQSKDPAVKAAVRRRLGKRLAEQKAAAAAKAKQADAAGHGHGHGAASPDAVEAAWAPEVDGVPTGSQVHYDDDTAISMEENKKYGKSSYRDGAGHHERHNETTVTEGDNKTRTEKVHDMSLGAKGAGYEQRSSREDSVGEDVSHKSSSVVGGNIGPKGVGIHGGHETEGKVGDIKKGRALDGSASVGFDGKVEVEGGRKVTTENEHGSSTKSHTAGYADGQVKVGYGKSETKKLDEKDEHGEHKTTSHSTTANARVGLDGVGADVASTRTNKHGTATSASAGFDAGKEGVSAHAGYSIISKGGTSATMSVSGGVKVFAEEPVQVGGEWEVQYVRTTKVGGSAGGGAKGAGFGGEVHAGANHSSFESGVRHFKTKKEAEEFKEKAAEKVQANVYSPDSLVGALQIPVGETRGVGSSNGLGAGGSISFEGASIGGDVHESSTREVGIKRVDLAHVEVTVVNSSEEGKDLNVSGGPIGGNWGTEDTRGKSITMRFDITTKEGQAAFQQFAKTGVPPQGQGKAGGTWISTERVSSHGKHDNFHVAGLGDDKRKQVTSEKHVDDQKGHHDAFKGEQSQDIDPSRVARFLGDKKQHSSVDFTSRMENGKEDGYTANMKVGGESGSYNREHLAQLYWGAAHANEAGKASGEWTLSADISKSRIHELERDVPALKSAKTTEDKMRILSQMVAENGARMLLGKGNFDVELKGDKNFPGRAGREHLEAELATLLKSLHDGPAAAAGIVEKAMREISTLGERRAAVADPKRYTDVPDGMRADQLKMIDKHIADFTGLRTLALKEAEKNKPGESIDKIRKRESDSHAFAGMSAEDKQLARLRDQIADKDDAIHTLALDNREANLAVQAALRSYKASPRNKKSLASALEMARNLDKRADGKDDAQASFDGVIGGLRLVLFSAQGHVRVTTASSLVDCLEGKRAAAAEMLELRKLAAEAMLNFASDRARGDHARFWNKLPMPDDEPVNDD